MFLAAVHAGRTMGRTMLVLRSLFKDKPFKNIIVLPIVLPKLKGGYNSAQVASERSHNTP